jgi:membrane-associated phospholipid phosphatase
VNRIKGWWPEAVLLAALGLVTLAAAKGWTSGADLAVRDAMRQIQVTPVYWLARGLNLLGQGIILTWTLAFGLTLYLWWRTRNWKVLLPWVVAYALTYLTIGPLKLWSDRDGPNSVLPNAVEFFNESAAYTMSYPSGHVVNAIVWPGVIVWLALKIRPAIGPVPLRLIRFAPPISVFCTTIYLGFHWFTDNVAGVCLGLLLARLVGRLLSRLPDRSIDRLLDRLLDRMPRRR